MTAGSLERFRHIAVEGPIGAGKTTLARRLAERLGAELLLEQPEENPFLARFYDDIARYALPDPALLPVPARAAVRALAQPEHVRADDRQRLHVRQGRALRALNLTTRNTAFTRRCTSRSRPSCGEPDLVIRLQASAPTLLARVRGRGMAMEHGIDVAYLQRLADAYAEFFASYDGAPVFAVDTERFHPLERASDLAELVRALERFEGRAACSARPPRTSPSIDRRGIGRRPIVGGRAGARGPALRAWRRPYRSGWRRCSRRAPRRWPRRTSRPAARSPCRSC